MSDPETYDATRGLVARRVPHTRECWSVLRPVVHPGAHHNRQGRVHAPSGVTVPPPGASPILEPAWSIRAGHIKRWGGCREACPHLQRECPGRYISDCDNDIRSEPLDGSQQPYEEGVFRTQVSAASASVTHPVGRGRLVDD